MSRKEKFVQDTVVGIQYLKNTLQALTNTVSRNETAHFKLFREERDKWKHEHDVLNEEVMAQGDMINKLLKIVKVSGILEVAETGDDLFQFHSTVDMLQSNPLYKINTVVTKEKK